MAHARRRRVRLGCRVMLCAAVNGCVAKQSNILDRRHHQFTSLAFCLHVTSYVTTSIQHYVALCSAPCAATYSSIHLSRARGGGGWRCRRREPTTPTPPVATALCAATATAAWQHSACLLLFLTPLYLTLSILLSNESYGTSTSPLPDWASAGDGNVALTAVVWSF